MTVTYPMVAAAMIALCMIHRPAARAEAIIVVAGDADAHERAAVRAAVETTARDAGWPLPERAASQTEAERLVQCSNATTPWTCIATTRGGRAIERVLVMAVDERRADNGAPMIVLTGKLIVAASRSMVVRQRFCEHCADDALAEASSALARQVMQEVAARAGRTILAVRSVPSGAQIIVDGVRIGATDGTFNTFPGRHVVIVEKPGYHPETRTIIADEGKTSEISIDLRPTGAVSPPGTQPSRIAPGLVIASGVALATAGALLIMIDEDPSSSGPQREFYRDSARHGAGYAVAGMVVAGAGVVWWSRRTRARTRPALSVIRGGGMLGWSGAF